MKRPASTLLTALGMTLLAAAGFVATGARSSAPAVAVLPECIFAPDSLPTDSSATTTTTERIFIEHVDLWRFDQEVDSDAQMLTGNVVFRHDSALMYCDSALLYREANRFEAFSNVHMHEAQDTVDVYCRYVDYDGATKLARLRELVQMEQGQNTLLTDSLDYDRATGIAYYFDYGSIADSLNILSSVYGRYSTIDKTAVFYDDVVLQNDRFTLYSDTLHYDTNTKIATILGPTTIESDSGVIYATRGTYRTEEDILTLLDRAEVVSGTRWMTGDSLIYDRPNHFADLYGGVILRDTTERMELRGDHVTYNDSTEYGEATERAYVYEYSDTAHLFAAAERMEMIKVDSANNIAKGLGNVRVWRSNVQAVSDTMLYLTTDSVMKMYGRPFIWSGRAQVTGDSVRIFMREGEIDRVMISENAYAVERLRDKYFNQMRGRELEAFFTEGEIDSVLTRGNAETIYYSENKDSVQTEQTHTQCSDIFTRFKDREVVRIMLLGEPKGTTKPIFLVEEEDLVYPGFVWFPEGRPTDSLDIFRRTPEPGAAGGEMMPKPPTSGLLQDLPVPETERAVDSLPPVLPADSIVTALADSLHATLPDSLGVSIDSLRNYVRDSLAVSLSQQDRTILRDAADQAVRRLSDRRQTDFLEGREMPEELVDSLHRVGVAGLDSLGLTEANSSQSKEQQPETPTDSTELQSGVATPPKEPEREKQP